MAQAKKVGKKGIDSWTNNGYGLVNVKPAISKAEAAAIDKEVREKRAKKNGR